MNKFTMTAALLTLLGTLVAAQADVAGRWTLTIHAQGQPATVPLTLEQDGARLTGRVGPDRVSGNVDGDRISMSYERNTAEVGPITLTFTGTIEGNRMSGTADFGGYADGSWEAARR